MRTQNKIGVTLVVIVLLAISVLSFVIGRQSVSVTAPVVAEVKTVTPVEVNTEAASLPVVEPVAVEEPKVEEPKITKAVYVEPKKVISDKPLSDFYPSMVARPGVGYTDRDNSGNAIYAYYFTNEDLWYVLTEEDGNEFQYNCTAGGVVEENSTLPKSSKVPAADAKLRYKKLDCGSDNYVYAAYEGDIERIYLVKKGKVKVGGKFILGNWG